LSSRPEHDGFIVMRSGETPVLAVAFAVAFAVAVAVAVAVAFAVAFAFLALSFPQGICVSHPRKAGCPVHARRLSMSGMPEPTGWWGANPASRS
jgi:hypothetical protein